MHTNQRKIDSDAYVRSTRTSTCFICEIVAGNPDFQHHIIYEDDHTIAFLNNYPTLYGYTLVAPKEHREQVTGDFTLDEYLRMQAVVYRVAEAVREETGAERVYILSLGSQQANSHVHWHIAPLPPGVPYEQQQFEALRIEDGVLDRSDEELVRMMGSPAAAADRARETLIMDLLREAKISQGKAAELLDATRWEMLSLMARYRIQVSLVVSPMRRNIGKHAEADPVFEAEAKCG